VRHEAERAASEFVEKSFPDKHGPIVVIHPGAGKKENLWPVARFAQVARILVSRADARIIVIEGPRDAQVASTFLDACPGAVRWRADLGATLGLLRRAALFLGNDTGMAHAAAAVGAPTVAVFGPTNPGRWSPAGHWVRCVRSPTGRVEDARTEDVVAAADAALHHADS
jgi:ADP-heptose:LPS heptosyltransferase